MQDHDIDGNGNDLTSGQVIHIVDNRLLLDCDHGDDGAGGGDADDDGGEDLTSGQVIQLVDQRLLLDGDHRTLLQIASQPVNFITRTDLQAR